MRIARGILSFFCLLSFGLSLAWACGFDDTLREYLSLQFWYPFAKHSWHFGGEKVRRASAPYAGMEEAHGETPLARLRAAYQQISQPDPPLYDSVKLQQALSAARSVRSLTPKEREEVDLIDAKIDLRAGSPGRPEPLLRAQKKLVEFPRRARTPEYLSEARGWLAYVHYLLGDQTAAGKIYLDELNRNGSNLSRETLVNSLRLTYGYDGGQELVQDLEEYFDTPDHAAFAIQLITNPLWNRESARNQREPEPVVTAPPPYARIKDLLEKHGHLFQSEKGANLLATLGMRTALRAGDPPGALRIASKVPKNARTRGEPDFNWMLASAHFLSHDYAAAERPLLRLFRSPRSSDNQRSAAAYALCGTYQKTGNAVEQIRMALWLHTQVIRKEMYMSSPSIIEDQSVYWAASGWDLGLLLDAEAPIEALRLFLDKYPDVPDVRLVRYALAVRLARDNEYDEAAQVYETIHAVRRAARMRQLASLYRETNRTDASPEETREAKYRMAEYLAANPERIYFNNTLWFGLQRYALFASKDSRLTREERGTLTESERKLKDDQEERWRAYLLLREVVRESGRTDLGRRAAQLALRCLRQISERFERQSEIHTASLELSSWLRRSSPRRNVKQTP